jgi:hypothetical protein
MRRKPIHSSAISSVGYDPDWEVLEVEFESGAVYDYFEVPPNIFEALLAAPSKGRFLASEIKDVYPCRRGPMKPTAGHTRT